MLKDYRFTIGFSIWIAIITFLSLSSFEDLDTGGLNIPHLDKVVHFIFYFVAAILGSLFLKENSKGLLNPLKAALLATIFAVIYGIVIEVIQSVFTQNRSGELFDVLANSLGAFCGAGLIIILFSGKTPLKWKN